MKRCGPLLVMAACMLTVTVARGEQPVTVWVTPRVASCHANARLTVLVARDDRNRQLIWEIDGANYFRSSAIELEGAAAPRKHSFLIRDLPAGEYEVRAIVTRTDSTKAVSRSDLVVVGGPD